MSERDRDTDEASLGSTRVPRVGNLLSESFVLLDLAARSMPEVCELLVERLVEQGDIPAGNASVLLEEILARERVSQTAIGFGATCPHAFVDDLKRPVVLFARLSSPLEVRTPDGTPADFVFLLVGRKEDARGHLESLLQLLRLMQDAGFRRDARAAETPGEIVGAALAAERRLRSPSLVKSSQSRAGV
jgi:mannitol/fructose-specific phosphotransferase system IIA component (Ntr-type)